MNKYAIWASVFVIPLLYELCRRVAAEHYVMVALGLHWLLTAAVLIWTKKTLAGPKDIGLPNLLKGFACFACCIALYCAALNWVFGSMRLGDWQWSLPGMTTFKRSGIVAMALSAGFCEEVIYRGYMMTALKKAGQPIWVAMVASSLSFVFFHGMLPTPMLVAGFVIAMIWAAIVQRTSLLWATVYIHAFWDASVALIPWHALFIGE
ncbi:MAG: CPBP family intramembrane glutamic endopeptidase [Planctomycetota bacterium]